MNENLLNNFDYTTRFSYKKKNVSKNRKFESGDEAHLPYLIAEPPQKIQFSVGQNLKQ